ncbi:MAG: protein-glutamate O-methyltransferase CheR [Candidatus Tectimicrobiota bacterium]
MQAEREFQFNSQDFDFLRRLVSQQTGIVLSEAKRDLVYGRLAKRLRQLGLESFRDYCQLLQEEHTTELENLVNAMTTNLTMFFRENHHFEYLAQMLLPGLMQARAHTRRLRIWSAGCSTGEEPYSIAMVCKEVLGSNDWDVKILATDIDSNVLATGQRGIYSADRVQGIAPARLRRWFQQGRGSQTGAVRVSPELQALITFRQLNLMQPWPMRGPFDVIFCRNVVIYFDKETQRQLFNRFADLLEAQGNLFVGHSESLFKVTERFELLGKTIYRRCL